MAGALFRLILFSVVEVEIEIAEEYGDVSGLGAKVVEGSALFLGGAACAAGTIDEAADAVHLEELVLLGGGDILENLGDELGADAVLNGLKDAEAVGDGRLAYVDDIADLDHARRLHLRAAYAHLSLFTGRSGHSSGLEDTGCPKPFVNAGLFHFSYSTDSWPSAPRPGRRF